MLNRPGTLVNPLLNEDEHPTLGANSHKGVVFQTTKSNVHEQGTSLQNNREKHSDEAFLNSLFSKCDLQKMVLQFTP